MSQPAEAISAESARAQPGTPWQLFILLLSLATVAATAVRTLGLVDHEGARILLAVDLVACLVFLADFVVALARAESPGRYLRWGWVDLVSSVPLLTVLRWGRLLSAARIVLQLREVRSLRALGARLLRRRAESSLLLGGLAALVLVAAGAVAMLHLEGTGSQAVIRDGSDALWWAVATVSTVGYGDVYPVTGGGRILAAVLMLVGTTLFGVFTGFVSSWFQRRRQGDEGPDLGELQAELRSLRRLVERRLGEQEPDPAPPQPITPRAG